MWVKSIFLGIGCLLLSVATYAQYPAGIREIEAEGNYYPIYGISISADNRLLAISSYGGRFYMMDVASTGNSSALSQSEKMLWSKAGINGFKWGAKPVFSKDGKYILLKPVFDNPYKTKLEPTVCRVYDAITGAEVYDRGDDVLSACFLNDNVTLLINSKRGLEYIDLRTGKVINQKYIANAETVAISNNGELIAVSYDPSKEELARLESIAGRKSELKNARVNKKLLSIYRADNFELVRTLDDEIDVVFRLQFSKDDQSIYLMTRNHLGGGQKDNQKQEGSVETLSAINFIKIDIATGKIDKSFYHKSNFIHCDFSLSPDQNMFALSNTEKKDVFAFFNGIEIYDIQQSEKKIYQLNTRFRFFKQYIFPYQFTFRSDKPIIYVGYNNQLLEWDYKKLPRHTFEANAAAEDEIRQMAAAQLDTSLVKGELKKIVAKHEIKGFHVFDITVFKKGEVSNIFAPVDQATDIRSQNLLLSYLRTMKFKDLAIPKDKRIKFRYYINLEE